LWLAISASAGISFTVLSGNWEVRISDLGGISKWAILPFNTQNNELPAPGARRCATLRLSNYANHINIKDLIFTTLERE
jgi:hypothetical protein